MSISSVCSGSQNSSSSRSGLSSATCVLCFDMAIPTVACPGLTSAWTDVLKGGTAIAGLQGMKRKVVHHGVTCICIIGLGTRMQGRTPPVVVAGVQAEQHTTTTRVAHMSHVAP